VTGPTPNTNYLPSRAKPARKGTSPTISAINAMNTSIDRMNSNISELVSTLKSTPAPTPGINWAPLVQTVASGVISALGGTVSFTSPSTAVPSSTTPATPAAPTITSSVEPTPLEVRLNKLESKYDNLASTVTTLVKGQDDLNTNVDNLTKAVNTLVQAMTPTSS
jgi:uncharacterized phage infection (PIP) family protein YhgE